MVSFESMGNVALNVVLILSGGAFAIGVAIAVGMYLRRLTRFNQFKVIIWEKDGLGNVAQKPDRAGIFVDPVTRNKRFFIKGANVGLEPDNIPYVQMGKHKFVYLVRTGLMNYRFIKPTIAKEILTFDVGEEDVNWSINAYERQKAVLMAKKWLQYLPYISLAVVSFVILIIFIYFFKELHWLKDFGQAFQVGMHEWRLATVGNGTMVIQ